VAILRSSWFKNNASNIFLDIVTMDDLNRDGIEAQNGGRGDNERKTSSRVKVEANRY
jgi:hypothetical protein